MPHQCLNLVHATQNTERERQERLIRVIEGQIIPRLLISLSTAYKQAADRAADQATSPAGGDTTALAPEDAPRFAAPG